jgi:hypothetical protein
MKKLDKILIVIFFAALISCSAAVREIKIPENQYQIVVETKGKDMDETMVMFHDKAKSLCPEYEVISINTEINFDWGLFIWTAVPLNKRTVTGIIKCK